VKLARTAAGLLTLTTMGGLPVSLAMPGAPGSDCVVSTHAGTPGSGSQASECGSAHDEEPKNKKRSRFCKAKRDQYRRLVERLVEMLREDPAGFSLESVRLPHSIDCSEEAKDKLLATVRRFASAA